MRNNTPKRIRKIEDFGAIQAAFAARSRCAPKNGRPSPAWRARRLPLADLSRLHLQRLQNLPQRLPEVFRHFELRDRPIRLGSPEAQFGR
jgi:hypothetical protein